MTAPKNLAASVKARLQNVATQRDESFNLLLTRYGIERLLYRLSQSPHADRFLLKGAMLFVIWDDHTHRPTRDLDLLGFVAVEKSEMTQIFRDVIGTTVPDDGLIFDSSSVQADEIRETATYGGIRIRLLAKLGSAEIPVQIDIGVGDAVTLEPESVMFPVLLDFPAPKVRVYPAYTVVAEKFEAMVSLGATNTRMKDFYDLWFLSHRFEFDPTLLSTAIQATFTRRQTRLTPNPEPFGENFATDPIKQVQWTAFLRRNDLRGASPQFPEVMAHIRDFIGPVFRSAFPG